MKTRAISVIFFAFAFLIYPHSTQQNSGKYGVQFEGSNFSSGIY